MTAPCPSYAAMRADAARGSAALLSALEAKWPCGCLRTRETTLWIGDKAQCRRCRRLRLRRFLRLLAMERAATAARIAQRVVLTPAEAVLEAVAEHYSVTVDDLTGPRRFASLVRSRHLAINLIHEHLRPARPQVYSYPGIGKIMGGRDHATVIHAIEVFPEHLKHDVGLQRAKRTVEARLRQAGVI